ncbi:hypothetical protein [Streptomyces spiramenti]|uniref:Uncharacterized protein n=1 Tax=Streptomyces spiramenti TaxID=2720606 RepID=A0ABX1AG39_9ACTN|nr:hypothetical protein [Streptomyces spiramenti]NJP66089.1 hypothetical protein [Streptomyces spiramenti]
MTATAPEEVPAFVPFHETMPATPHGPSLTLSACGGYAARLATVEAGWYAERWTLDGPEPYAVPLPGSQPEDPGTEVLPLSDGRVLIARRSPGSYLLSLLYPTGPDTGELSLGSVGCPWMTLLPPAPDGVRAYGLVVEGDTTTVWLVCGDGRGPHPVLTVPGRCQDGAWLDRSGRLLALNRTDSGGRTRAVTVDVAAGGEAAVLLQIGERSNDRLLLADPDSGLLLVASDAPGKERIGWGVLGSHRPVRFPEALYPDGVAVHPLAVQPAQVLTPESCGVALRLGGPEGDWPAVWRPQQRDLQHFPAPAGWLPDGSHWTAGGELVLPFVESQAPCGVVRLRADVPDPAVSWHEWTAAGGSPGGHDPWPAVGGHPAGGPGPSVEVERGHEGGPAWTHEDPAVPAGAEESAEGPGGRQQSGLSDVAPWAPSVEAAGLPTPTPWAGTPVPAMAPARPGDGEDEPRGRGRSTGPGGDAPPADDHAAPRPREGRDPAEGHDGTFSMRDHAWAADAGWPQPVSEPAPGATEGTGMTPAPGPPPGAPRYPGGTADTATPAPWDDPPLGPPSSWSDADAAPTAGAAPSHPLGPQGYGGGSAPWTDPWSQSSGTLPGAEAGRDEPVGQPAAGRDNWAGDGSTWFWAQTPAGAGPGDPARVDHPDGLRLPGDGGRYAAGFPPSGTPTVHHGYDTSSTAAYQPAGSTMTDSNTDTRTDPAPTPAGAEEQPMPTQQQDRGTEDSRTQGVCKPIPLQQAPLGGR